MSTVCSQYYAGENDRCLPYISPLYGDLHSLPPLLIYVGNDELMRDDSTRFAEKAKTAGVGITLKVGEGMVHCYPLFAPLFPEATQAMNEICAYIQTPISKQEEPVATLINNTHKRRITMKILIAGASGMIGSAVAPYLASQGHEVIRLVRREPGDG